MRCIMDSWRICRNGEILDHTGRCHFFLFSEWLSTWSGQHTYVSKLHVHKKSCFQSQACVSYSRILSTEPFSLLVLWDLLMQKGTPGSWLLPACNEGWCHVRNIRRVGNGTSYSTCRKSKDLASREWDKRRSMPTSYASKDINHTE